MAFNVDNCVTVAISGMKQADASSQIKTVVDKGAFTAIDLILAVFICEIWACLFLRVLTFYRLPNEIFMH
jgi:hypothetical protein